MVIPPQITGAHLDRWVDTVTDQELATVVRVGHLGTKLFVNTHGLILETLLIVASCMTELALQRDPNTQQEQQQRQPIVIIAYVGIYVYISVLDITP